MWFWFKQPLVGEGVLSDKQWLRRRLVQYMPHAFLKNEGIILQCWTKTQKYPVTNKVSRYGCKKASNKISANRISHFVTF